MRSSSVNLRTSPTTGPDHPMGVCNSVECHSRSGGTFPHLLHCWGGGQVSVMASCFMVLQHHQNSSGTLILSATSWYFPVGYIPLENHLCYEIVISQRSWREVLIWCGCLIIQIWHILCFFFIPWSSLSCQAFINQRWAGFWWMQKRVVDYFMIKDDLCWSVNRHLNR